MARSVSSSSRKEVITDVVTTTLQRTTSRLVPAHSNEFPSPISTGLAESVKLAANDQIVDGVRLESMPKEKLPSVQSMLSRYIRPAISLVGYVPSDYEAQELSNVISRVFMVPRDIGDTKSHQVQQG
jgi:hypothetical protein